MGPIYSHKEIIHNVYIKHEIEAKLSGKQSELIGEVGEERKGERERWRHGENMLKEHYILI